MKLKRFVKGNGLKYLIMSLAGLAALLLILTGISFNIYNMKYDDRIGKLSDAFTSIADELEFNGFSNAVTEKIKAYNQMYNSKVNVIIADKEGKVVYNLNNAYLPEKGLFYTVYRKGTQYIDIVDSAQKPKYTAILDYSYNNFGKNKSISVNRNMDLIASRLENASDEVEAARFDDRETLGKWSGSDDQATLYMESILISSKGYSLYSLSAHDPTYMVWSDNSIMVYDVLGNTLGPASGAVIIIYWLSLPIWVFADAQKRGFRASMWTLLVLLTNIIGLLVYLVVRPEHARCKSCGKQLSSSFISCPYCGTRNRDLCTSCGLVLEEEWLACPRCGKFKEGVEASNSEA